ncbi:DUF2231 domain-containing protein [Actinomadura miaoliensis]|uniref:DUF2231 domain-containing protein n=1 Tax=Actinomadura miaoliensis TaxID=430685 RepID=A0ABP7VNI7_9ACTN
MAAPVQRQDKRPVSAVLTGPYGHPFHPMLVTVPIGAWVGSLVFDIASQVVDDPAAVSRGALWLIAVGVIGAVAAASVGVLDLSTIPPGTRAFRVGVIHATLNLLVTAAYVAGFLWRNAAGGPSGSVGTGQLALSAVSLAVLGVSGYLGGMLAYHYGVRVADEATQAEGFVRPLQEDPADGIGDTEPHKQ